MKFRYKHSLLLKFVNGDPLYFWKNKWIVIPVSITKICCSGLNYLSKFLRWNSANPIQNPINIHSLKIQFHWKFHFVSFQPVWLAEIFNSLRHSQASDRSTFHLKIDRLQFDQDRCSYSYLTHTFPHIKHFSTAIFIF